MSPRVNEYTPPPLARFFNSFPHLNISLHYVNSTFLPESEIYLESLGILGSIPAAWLILTLLVLLIYLLTRCCDRKPRPKHSIVLLKWTLAIFTLLCCAAVGVGLYGNDDVHNALMDFIAALSSIDSIVSAVKNQTTSIEATLQYKVQPRLTELGDLFDNPVANQTVRGMLLSALSAVTDNTTRALLNTQEISRPLSGLSLGRVIGFIQLTETFRWPVTMGVLSVLLVFCVLLLFGVIRHSRCALITFSVFGLFAVIISWLLASVYLTISVALGDLCMSLNNFLDRVAGNAIKVDILSYYLRCETAQKNPFTQRVQFDQLAVKGMGSNLNQVTDLAKYLYTAKFPDLPMQLEILRNEVNLVDSLVSGLAALLDCKPLHRQYINAAKSVCDLGLYGLSFMLMSAVLAGLFFTVLVWVDSHTWIYIRRRRDYLQVDEQDPFLPPSAASQAVAARTLRSQGSYGSTGYFWTRNSSHTPPSTSPYLGTLNGRSSREEKSQHGSHYEQGGREEHGAGSMLGPNHGQYATLSKQCKTLESSDFY